MKRWFLIAAAATTLLVALALLTWGRARWERGSPAQWTRGNILPNADFAAASGPLPTGWTVGGPGVELSQFTFTPGGRSVALLGTNNYLRSPLVAVRPGQRLRVGLRALAENPTPARLRVWFHWLDAEADEVRLDKREWHAVPGRAWALILEETTAPPAAAHLAISLHPASDDRIFIDDLALNVAGVYVEPWPAGRRAAVSLSVDWETAMGGLIHSRDGAADVATAEARGLAMREGTGVLLGLLRPHGLRATWFGNGYNFLRGNAERRTWLGDPTFAWADPAHRWGSAAWASQPWFAADPHGTVASHPAWYFGDLVPALLAERQAIQSHTFSHLYAGFADPATLAADAQAWNALAAAAGVAPASALAFPWSGSDGMTDAHWLALRQHGISEVTRTKDDVARYAIARDDLALPRSHPGYPELLVVPDQYLLPATLTPTLATLDRAAASGGAIDIWAHTEEIVTPAQIAAWQAVVETLASRDDLWVAPLAEIAAWWRGVRQVEATIVRAGPPTTLRLHNAGPTALPGLTVRLPAPASRAESDGRPLPGLAGDRLTLDLAPHQTLEVTLWPAS